MILDRFFIKGLVNNDCSFKMNIQVDDEENILNVKYEIKENNNIE